MTGFIKQYWRWIVLGVFFWGMFFFFMPSGFYDLGSDSAQYIILAESLVSGQGYHAINFPDKPFYYHYPPLFPLTLTPIIYFFGRNFFLIHCLVALLGFLSLGIFYRLFKKCSDADTAFAAICLFAVTIPFFLYSVVLILSEMLFLFCCGCALLCAVNYSGEGRAITRWGGLAALSIVAAYFTRYCALALILGILLYFAFCQPNGKKVFKKIFFVSGIFLLFFVSWQTLSFLKNHEAPVIYARQFNVINPYDSLSGSALAHPFVLLYNFVTGLAHYVLYSGELFLFSNMPDNYFCIALSGAVSLVVSYGLWIFERRRSVWFFYFIIYFMLIAYWPFGKNIARETMRFILPVLPFICFYLVVGLKQIASCFLKDNVYRVVYGFIIVSICFTFSLRCQSLSAGAKGHEDLFAVYRYMKSNTGMKGIALTRLPVGTYFYAGWPAVVFPYTHDESIMVNHLREKNIEYVILDTIRTTEEYLVPFVYRHKSEFEPVYGVGNCVLLKRKLVKDE